MSVINKLVNKGNAQPVNPNSEVEIEHPLNHEHPAIQRAKEKVERTEKRKAELEKKKKDYERISLAIRSDLYKQIKVFSLQDDRFYYDIIEDAIRDYIKKRLAD